jgi:hydrogenase maturation protease
VIIVDALPRGQAAGTLYVVEPNLAAASAETAINPHGMDPVQVLNLAASQGTITAQVLVLGCEPQDFGDELEGRMGLSARVQAAVPEAAKMALELADRIATTEQVSLV